MGEEQKTTGGIIIPDIHSNASQYHVKSTLQDFVLSMPSS